MKKNLLLILAVLLTAVSFSQAPQAFKFQTVVRNGNGEVLPLQDITLNFKIHLDAPEGEVVYSEQHFVTTNTSGLVNIDVGKGEILSGSFVDIIWGEGEYFFEELIDIGNTGEFQVFGTVQLMSVPYALYANTAGNSMQALTTEERDALENPTLGMQIYNISTHCLNYFGGTSWYETCGDCTPMPSQAEAGANQDITDGTLSTNLEGNSPEFGIGTWSVMSGAGGVYEDENDPLTLFTGEECEYYLLKWVITNPCGTTTDYVSIEFNAQPTPAFAGEDQFLINAITTTLAANTPLTGAGIWNIISGQGGSFSDPNIPNAVFTGQPCENYTLNWTISTLCSSSYDQVEIQFNATPTMADAGENQIGLEGSWTALDANEPLVGEGLWTILEGEGGQVTSPHDPTSIFLGQINEQYLLEWQISTICDTTRDEVSIGFGILPIVCGFTVVGQTGGRTASPSSAVQSNHDLKSSTPLSAIQTNQEVKTASPLSATQTNQEIKASSPLSVAQENQNVKATGGISSLTINSLSSWEATESVSWLSVKPSNGSPIDNTLTFIYETNTSAESRTGHITINANDGADVANITVTQAGVSRIRGMGVGLVWICGLPIGDLRDSSVYSTVQIGNQCWMAKNLNIGTRIDSKKDQTDNGTIEKYCYENNEANCDTYGGLYTWDEMMQYANNEAAQGICPEGWYLPTDADWCTLEQEVDPAIICSTGSWRGIDGGAKLKYNGDSGFKATLAGTNKNSSFFNMGSYTVFWSSSEYSRKHAWLRSLDDSHNTVHRADRSKNKGYSIRCLKHN